MSFAKTLKHLQKVDPTLYEVGLKIQKLQEITPLAPEKYFEELASHIVGQQLSGKVADVIWARVKTKLVAVTPENILKTSDEDLRACGLSYAKIKYLKDLAAKNIDFANLNNLSDQEVIAELTHVKGIGPWTAEMFLIFTLGRPNVFSKGDLGLKNAIKKLYAKEPDVETWSPYKSYASRILWKSLELE